MGIQSTGSPYELNQHANTALKKAHCGNTMVMNDCHIHVHGMYIVLKSYFRKYPEKTSEYVNVFYLWLNIVHSLELFFCVYKTAATAAW